MDFKFSLHKLIHYIEINTKIVYNWPLLGHSFSFSKDAIEFWEKVGKCYGEFRARYPDELYAVFMFSTKRMVVPIREFLNKGVHNNSKTIDSVICLMTLLIFFSMNSFISKSLRLQQTILHFLAKIIFYKLTRF